VEKLIETIYLIYLTFFVSSFLFLFFVGVIFTNKMRIY